MALKNPHNHVIAIACGFTAILLAGSLLLVGMHLILAGDWKGYLFLTSLTCACMLAGVVLVAAALFAVFSYVYLLRERQYRSLASNQQQVAKKGVVQPDEHVALLDGESIALARRRSWRGILTWLCLVLIFPLLMAFMGEMVVFFALPTLGNSAVNPFYTSLFFFDPPPAPSPPSWLDWFSAAFPLALSVLLLIALLIAGLLALRQEIIADDRGIAQKTLLRGCRFIPWNDIALFVRSVEKKPGQLEGSYALWGKDHLLVFEIDGPPPAKKQQRKTLDMYRYEGGYDQYQANAERLLATVAARAHVPLCVYVTPKLVKRLARRYPHLLSLEDIANAPLASYEQTAEDSIGKEGALPSEVRLGARLSLPGLVLEPLIWSGVLMGLLLVFPDSIPGFTEVISSGLLPFPWLYVLLAVLILPLAFALAYERRRNKRPVIIADSQGLTRKADKQNTLSIPWGEIEAWAIKRLPRDGYEDKLYVVCSVSQTLTWVEPANAKLAGRGVQQDRQEAYRERAAQLHRLIALRTGQPLREILAQPTTLL